MFNPLLIAVDTMGPETSSGIDKVMSALRRPRQSNRPDNKPSQEWRNNEPQCISGEYIVPERLEAALKRNWHNQYAVEVSLQLAGMDSYGYLAKLY